MLTLIGAIDWVKLAFFLARQAGITIYVFAGLINIGSDLSAAPADPSPWVQPINSTKFSNLIYNGAGMITCQRLIAIDWLQCPYKFPLNSLTLRKSTMQTVSVMAMRSEVCGNCVEEIDVSVEVEYEGG